MIHLLKGVISIVMHCCEYISKTIITGSTTTLPVRRVDMNGACAVRKNSNETPTKFTIFTVANTNIKLPIYAQLIYKWAKTQMKRPLNVQYVQKPIYQNTK